MDKGPCQLSECVLLRIGHDVGGKGGLLADREVWLYAFARHGLPEGAYLMGILQMLRHPRKVKGLGLIREGHHGLILPQHVCQHLGHHPTIVSRGLQIEELLSDGRMAHPRKTLSPSAA
jgi:hypothetical protein